MCVRPQSHIPVAPLNTYTFLKCLLSIVELLSHVLPFYRPSSRICLDLVTPCPCPCPCSCALRPPVLPEAEGSPHTCDISRNACRGSDAHKLNGSATVGTHCLRLHRGSRIPNPILMITIACEFASQNMGLAIVLAKRRPQHQCDTRVLLWLLDRRPSGNRQTLRQAEAALQLP